MALFGSAACTRRGVQGGVVIVPFGGFGGFGSTLVSVFIFIFLFIYFFIYLFYLFIFLPDRMTGEKEMLWS